MIDFDRIYSQSLAPAIEDAGLEPIRADHERTGGVIHKPMFERLLLCDFAIADLTTANANVFYELGVRHTARPATTLTIFADHQPIPFDVNFLSSVAYDLGENNRFGDEQATALRTVVADKLVDLRSLAAKQSAVDSPLFQLLDEWRPSDIARLKADVFRDRVQLNETYKQQLGAIREKAKNEESRQDAMDELAEIRGGLPSFDAVDAGTTMDLMLTYRALEDWDGMIAVVEDMPQTLKRQVFVREQLGFAHNRRAGETKNPADRAEALRVLSEVEDQQGPSSETCGLIGRIHKDSWNAALEAGDPLGAAGHLKMAIAAYTRGFMADQRDAYPGINAITLLDIKGDEPSLRQKERLLPVVRFAVEQRLEGRQPDYWDHATMLELSVLGGDAESANESLADALAVIRETMEPRSTANNLRMIRRAREERGELQDWLGQVIEELEKRAG
ncbi:MAG: DUF4071 domain-containing protein [bacterium]|nr:DUF4071 domain-containing protein [bacterium]